MFLKIAIFGLLARNHSDPNVTFAITKTFRTNFRVHKAKNWLSIKNPKFCSDQSDIIATKPS